MNVIVLKGRLTADPELKNVGAKQTAVCDFSIATNRRFEKEKTDFISCQAWGQTAEFISKYFSKGKEIAVVGELHIDRYEKDGGSRYITRVKVDGVEFCGSKNDNQAEPNPKPNAKANIDVKASDIEEIDDSDLPF